MDWKYKKLNEVAQVIGGGTPRTNNHLYWGGNVSWITPRDLSNHNSKYIEEGERKISKLGLENCSAKLLPAGTVLFSSRAPIGYVAIAKKELATNQGFRSFVINKQAVFNEFLYYSLIFHRDNIKAIASGSTFKEISGTTIGNFKIPLPLLPEQQAIAKILSDFDAKIEVLRKQNETLEAMGQALFRHWFVDFEFPDENGKPYKSSGGKMQNSELGEIPSGWNVGKLGGQIKLEYGKGLPKKNRTLGQFPVVGSNGIVDYHNEWYVEGPGIVIGRKGTLGQVTFIYESFFPIDTTFYVGTENIYYSYYLLKGKAYLAKTSDSAVPGLNRNIALSHLEIIPTLDLIIHFESTIKSFFDTKKVNEEQIKTLQETRDTLLPKLMGGEVRVV